MSGITMLPHWLDDGSRLYTKNAARSTWLTDDQYYTGGNALATPDWALGWNTAQTVDALFLGLPAAQNVFVIAERADAAFDFAHGAQTNPTVFIHSATQSTTQWGSLAHDQTNFVLTSGAGAVSFVPSGVGASSILLTNSAGARTVAHTVVAFNGTAGAAAGGTLFDINVSQTGAGASPLFDIDVSAVYTGEIFSAVIGAVAYTSDVLSLDLGATSVGGQLIVLSGGAAARTTHLVELNDAGTSTGVGFDINKTGGSYSTGLGYFDLVRSGNFTGVAAETAMDFRIAPSFTLTEPAAGTFTYYCASIDLSGVLVTAGAGTTLIAALTLTASADADIGRSRSLVLGGSNVQNSIQFGTATTAPIMFSNGAETLLFEDSTAARGIVFTLTAAGAQTIGTTAGNLTLDSAGTGEIIISSTNVDVVSNTLEMNNVIQWDTGAAVTAGAYQVTRDADGTNQLHLNVPTGAGFELSVNDVAVATLTTASMINAGFFAASSDGYGFGTTSGLTQGVSASGTTTRIRGSGANALIELGNGTGAVYFQSTGLTTTMTQTAGTSGSPVGIILTSGAHTTLANADLDDVNFNFARTVQFTGGAGPVTIADIRGLRIQAPTYQTAGAGALTITNASTVYISGAPATAAGGGGTTITNPYGLFVDAGAVRFDAHLQWGDGVAVTAGNYSIGRDADGTNQLHLNVPTGATFELSVNDAVEMTLSATAVNFQNNTITTTGGGSLTGTWSDMGSVTTIDINGGTIDGVTIGGAVAGAITGTTITANTNFVPDANDGAGLGISGTAFSDLFLADGGVINWNAANATLTQSANALALDGATWTLKRHAAFAGSGSLSTTAAVTTTDATITNLYTLTLTDNTVYYMTADIVARRSDSGTENSRFSRVFLVYRQGAGAATLGAATVSPWADEQLTMAGVVTVDTSTNDIRVRVTGQAGKTIQWTVTVRYQAVSGSA